MEKTWSGGVFGKNASWCELIACSAMIIVLHNTLWRGCGVEQLPVDTLESGFGCTCVYKCVIHNTILGVSILEDMFWFELCHL